MPTHVVENSLHRQRWDVALLRQLTIVLSITLMASAYESFMYARMLRFSQLRLSLSDWVLIGGSVAAKSYLLISCWPILAICLRKWVGSRLSDQVGIGVPLAINGFLVCDVIVQSKFGNHIRYFVRLSTEKDSLAWAGNLFRLTQSITVPLLVAAAVFWLIRIVLRSRLKGFELISTRFVRLGLISEMLVIAGTIAYVIAFRPLAPQRLALERLYAAFPASLGLFDWRTVSDHGETAFGVQIDHQFDQVGEALARISKTSAAGTPVIPLLTESPLPNVVVFIVECLRRNAIHPATMPRLDRWARSGLRLKEHCCGSNCSPLGTFSLVYGRTPLAYHAALDHGEKPLMVTSLKAAGYETSLVSSCSFNHRRMNIFMSESVFDDVSIHQRASEDWPSIDRQCMSDVREKLSGLSRAPQLICVYLFSTHFDYQYPPQYANFDGPPPSDAVVRNGGADLQRRYHRSLRFMDDLLGDFVENLSEESSNTIVAITGDHGESFGEDGFLCHGSRLSDIQTQPSFVCKGPGIPAKSISSYTSHLDIAPTLLHAVTGRVIKDERLHGVDLLGDQIDEPRLIVQERTNDWDILLFSEHGRLMANLGRQDGRFSVRGFMNASGEVRPELAQPSTKMNKWIEKFNSLCRRLSDDQSHAGPVAPSH